MNSRLREQATKLRLEKELSYGEIKKRLNVAESTLSYWLREFPLTEEKIKELRKKGWKKGEASRERFRLTMRKKKEARYLEVYNKYQKRFTEISKESFFIAGLMLYLGEGDKRNESRIGLTNTDPWVIKFFVKWLIDFLSIPKEKIKVQLYLYENMNVGQENRYQSNGRIAQLVRAPN